MNLSDTIAYYQNLLITQYRLKPKAKTTIALIVNQALCDGLPMQLARCFDLDFAVGAQLDILGRIVGVSRYAYGLDLTHTFFSFVMYTDTTERPGFGRYADKPYTSSIWLRYLSNSVLQMTDFEMLNCLKLKIIQNNRYTNLKDLSEAFWDAFQGGITLTDNRNMTITYEVTPEFYRIVKIASYLNILPKSMGVAISSITESSSSSSSCRSSSSSSRSSSSSSSCRSSSSSSSQG